MKIACPYLERFKFEKKKKKIVKNLFLANGLDMNGLTKVKLTRGVRV
jgi:hypothetical protein